MDFFIIVIVGVVEAVIAIGAMAFIVKQGQKSGSGAAMETLAARRELIQGLRGKLDDFYSQLIELPGIASKAKDLRGMQDAVKAERGRITITQAELETIETRLRELEEIERELEASGIETKEELNILQKKEKELSTKNEALKNQIASSAEQVDLLLSQIETSAQVKEQVQMMKTELVQTEMKVAELLMQIEQGNEQYFVLKQRYDALDIEYAQLYEKFSEAEAMMGQGKDKEEK